MPQQLSIINPRLPRTGVEHRAAPALDNGQLSDSAAGLFETTYPCWSCRADAPINAVNCPACGAPQLEQPSTVEGRSRPQIEYTTAGRVLGIR